MQKWSFKNVQNHIIINSLRRNLLWYIHQRLLVTFLQYPPLFPWAVIITLFPFSNSGFISVSQYSTTLLIVSTKFSVFGSSSLVKSLYLGSLPGYLGSVSSNSGGLTSVLLLHNNTCSAPYFSLVSSLFNPCKAPEHLF